MTAKELDSIVNFNGQYRAMRKLCIDRKIVPVEKLALMDSLEVCEEIAKHFEFLGIRDGGETIFLVEKNKWDEILDYLVPLYR